MLSLCVFCGASSGHDHAYADAARAFGQSLAEHRIELVWGGGHVGLMGVVADAVHAHRGKSYGVIPEFMAERELAHPFATEMVVVDSMHTRKAAMAERAQGFVALPGGYGTMDELFEILTWAQLHIHHKPVGLLNVKGFFDPLLAFMRHMVSAGFVKQTQLDQLHVAESPEALIAAMRLHRAPEGDWLAKVSSARG
ncbi:LOG family protein [Uliginosibacterium aquaticum]|uniref:Cytokinin riboside 5'-monophosphate phosphoribohydrolase n=1 Tax=Uliginosibacterium aquaticum TaxID=2731212 RepID=A0ABX2IQH5_9RHOO|nr:TIGR00730 family Rossman fold protein [Uliginosibacterium aquaticum]NSL56546.1 TIGR00730 family Rossman fold protein [Uliginosibacterium aquaticum]